ncbi:MAG: SdiA-regulated domain-containing protein [Melioribacteraceae bacterium]|nr:SdiA-regulated domain-containing protein [Melioribacteraceae bacterium]
MLITLIFACSSTMQKESGIFEHYDFKSPQQFTITNKLNEISGLANSFDGNIFAINDEEAIIYILNHANGKIIKWFSLGKWAVEADFEGIASANQFIYAITSNGTLYKFREGNDKEAINYEIIKLPFSSNFNIEGLYYDEELNGLLIACKDYSGKKYKGNRAVYFYSLSTNEVNKEALFTISLNELKKVFEVKDFYPSGITKHPKSGNYLILSSKGDNVIVEVNISGQIMAVKKLKENLHRQPEGITILDDFSLIISDEAAGKRPKLTKYQYNDK